MELTIACCLWGNWPAKGWGEEYVYRLKRAVGRNLSIPHKFVCFADETSRINDETIDVRPLDAPSWLGCLPKLYVYSPAARLEGRVILLDLDDVITSSLDPMAQYSGQFAVRAWFAGYPKQKVADGDMIGFEANSFTSRRIWSEFIKDVPKAEADTGGRERFFLRSVTIPDLWQDILGEKFILSYKRHLRRNKELPEGVSIVSFHDRGVANGTSRPHQINLPWLERHWI